MIIRVRLHATMCYSCVDDSTGEDCAPPENIRAYLESVGMSLVPDREIPHADTEQPGDYE